MREASERGARAAGDSPESGRSVLGLSKPRHGQLASLVLCERLVHVRGAHFAGPFPASFL